MRNFTVLFDLRRDDFDGEVIDTIKEFVKSPVERLLTICYNEDDLVATLGIPDFTFDDLFYFLKQEDKFGNLIQLTVKNFATSISCGSIDAPLEGSILRLMETLFTPEFYNNTSWPYSILKLLIVLIHSVCNLDLQGSYRDQHDWQALSNGSIFE